MPSPALRRIVLCADDYALHPHVDAAVQELAAAGRLSATSAMVTAPGWPQAATALRALRPQLQVGLHFNLTESHHGHYPAYSLGQVLRQAYSGQLRPTALRQQWAAQLDAFEDALGSQPDFIDGHQHVHQLPGVRQALYAEWQHRYGSPPRGTPEATQQAQPWVRSTLPAEPLWQQPKAMVLTLLGGWAHHRQLGKLCIPSNQGFAGVYGFNAPSTAAYGAHMARWLAAMPTHLGLLMCHPASGLIPGDAIARQRPIEWQYLASDAFGDLLAAQGCQIHQGPGG